MKNIFMYNPNTRLYDLPVVDEGTSQRTYIIDKV